MSYYDESIGYVQGEPHYDDYFSEPEVVLTFAHVVSGAVGKAANTADLLLALGTLTPRQRFVIEQRFGLGAGGQSHSLDEVATAMGISKGAAQGIERRALESLRRGLGGLWGLTGDPLE